MGKIDFFTVQEMAAMLRYKHVKSLRNRLARDGGEKGLPPVKRIGRRILFNKNKYLEWLSEK